MKILLWFYDGFKELGSAEWITFDPSFDGDVIQSLAGWLLDFDENGIVENIDIDIEKFGDTAFRFDTFRRSKKHTFIILHKVSRKELEREKERLSKWLKELENLSASDKVKKI